MYKGDLRLDYMYMGNPRLDYMCIGNLGVDYMYKRKSLLRLYVQGENHA
jgi:hypothetical protein